MKNITLLLLLVSASVYAQPTLTATTNNPVIGDRYFNYYCHEGSVSVGTGGAGIVWNYSTLADSSIDTVSIVTCASTPYCDSLLPCTAVSTGNVAHGYRGLTCSASAFDWVTSAYTDLFGSFHVFYQYTDRPYRLLKYPMNYGDNWHDSCIYRVPTNNQTTAMTQIHTVDGYGTLITPAGTYTNTLRVHVTSFYANSFPGLSLQYARTEDYFWFTPGYHDPLLMIHVHIDSISHVVETGPVVFSTYAPLAAENITIEQTQINVYPNPANGILNFTSELKNCTAALTDITGRTVATARECFADGKGQIDVSGIPGGIYLLQLKNDAAVQTSKVVVGSKQ